jgi:hypothetical protein
MCDACLQIEHADGDWIFRHVFGHHPSCPNLDPAAIKSADLGSRLDRYIQDRAAVLSLKKDSARLAHETRRRNDRKPAKDRPVREHDIQAVLFKHLYWQKKHKWIAPNVDIFSTGEMDLCSITKAGLVHEYEIKLTRSDFLADRKKEHKHPQLQMVAAGLMFSVSERSWKPGPDVRRIKAPNYYSYVVPADMVNANELPPYAGLIYVDLTKLWSYGSAFTVVVKPTLLHKTPADDGLKLAIGEKLMYRCWSAREKLTKQHAMSQETI